MQGTMKLIVTQTVLKILIFINRYLYMEFENTLKSRCYLRKIMASDAVPLQSQPEFKDKTSEFMLAENNRICHFRFTSPPSLKKIFNRKILLKTLQYK